MTYLCKNFDYPSLYHWQYDTQIRSRTWRETLLCPWRTLRQYWTKQRPERKQITTIHFRQGWAQEVIGPNPVLSWIKETVKTTFKTRIRINTNIYTRSTCPCIINSLLWIYSPGRDPEGCLVGNQTSLHPSMSEMFSYICRVWEVWDLLRSAKDTVGTSGPKHSTVHMH